MNHAVGAEKTPEVTESDKHVGEFYSLNERIFNAACRLKRLKARLVGTSEPSKLDTASDKVKAVPSSLDGKLHDVEKAQHANLIDIETVLSELEEWV